MDAQYLRDELNRLRGKRDQVQTTLNKARERAASCSKSMRHHERARQIIKEVGMATQEQLTYNISEITTMALNAVLENPYDLTLKFVERRDRTECDILFTRGGIEIEPYEGGGGPVDVAAFALRVAAWSMSRPRTRATLILDEPFKHLKGETANRKMLEMVSEVSSKLGLQIIMVSDERVSRSATVEATDRLFETSIVKGITRISAE